MRGGEEESEYISIEPRTRVWELARKVNLHREERSEDDASEERIATTTAALDAAFVALDEPGESDDATRDVVRKALVEADADLTDPALGRFLELVLALNAAWRITTAWERRRDGKQAASAGRSTSAKVWKRITDLCRTGKTF